MFEGCDRRSRSRLAHWVEILEVDAGEVLVREDRGDFWFFVIITGHVHFTCAHEDLHTLGPGSHFGHDRIVGLRPQCSTGVTTEKTTLLVLGAQYLLSVLVDCPGFQRQLFPDVDPRQYRDFAKRMHRQGREEWRDVAVRHPLKPIVDAPDVYQRRERVRGRPLTMREAAARFAEMPTAALATRRAPPPPAPLPRWVPAALAAVAAVVVGLVLFAYHPPRAVITGARPVDVMTDITVTGHPPAAAVTGHYLLLTVRVTRPNLAGYLLSVWHGDRAIAVGSGRVSRAERAGETAAGRRQYLDSQRTAIAVAEGMAGVDPSRVSIRIRDRGLIGPSGGLVYSLALTDLLTGRDCAGGRVVAATGEVDDGGRVGAVGWVDVKLHTVDGAHAALVVVPTEEAQQASRAGSKVLGASTVRQAIDEVCGGPAGRPRR